MAENEKENNIPVQELEDGSAKVALELEKDPFEEKPEEKADGGEVKASEDDEEADDALFSILFDLLFSWDFQFDKFSTKLSERKSEVLAGLPTRW